MVKLISTTGIFLSSFSLIDTSIELFSKTFQSFLVVLNVGTCHGFLDIRLVLLSI